MFTYAIPAQAILALHNCASTEEPRYYLNGVCITRRAPHVLAVATDGHVLGVMRIDAIMPSGAPPIIIATIGKGFLFRALKPEKRDGWLTRFAVITTEDGRKGNLRVVLAATADDAATDEAQPIVQFSNALIDGNFPDVARVVPPYPTTPCEGVAAYNPDLITRLAKAGILKDGDAMRIVAAANVTDPNLVFFPGNPDFFGVIMPMKAVDTVLPTWWDMP